MKKLLVIFCCLLLSLAAWPDDELVAFHLSTVNGLPDNDIRYMEQDKTGYIYMLSLYAAYQYDGYNFRRLPDSEYRRLMAASKKRIYAPDGSFRDNLGNKVTVGKDGFIHWHDSKTRETVDMKVFDGRTLAVSNDLKLRVVAGDDGQVWVSVNGNGLFRYDRKTGRLHHYTENSDKDIVSNDFVVYMMGDRDGNVWISTEHYGLHCLRMSSRRYGVIDVNGDKDKRNNVRLLRRLADGTIIVADNYGALFRSGNELRTLTPVPALNETYIDACLDGAGRLWLGSRQSGVRIDSKFYGSGRVDCILRDSRGRMWMCGLRKPLICASLSQGGAYSEKRFFGSIKGLEPRVLIEDHTGRMWLGTARGLYAFYPDRLLANGSDYKKVSSLPVRSMLEDSRHRLWIGTEGHGVLVGNVGEAVDGFKRYSTENGLPNDVVQLIAEDAEHHVCVGTENGCAYIGDGGIVYTLYFPDNLARNFFNERSGVLLHNGRMAFATMDGIVVADADIWRSRRVSHGVAITGMTVNGTSVYQMGDDSPVEGDMSNAAEVRLAHNQNNISVSFSAFSYDGQPQTLYSYRLEGYDKEWSAASQLNFAVYKNLSPGTYRLHLRSRQRGGDWTERARVLKIVVRPPVWLSWWAIVLYAVLAGLIGWTVYRQLRTTYRLRQNIRLEKQLTEFKLKFFTNVSHEFRTPLTLIQGAMERLKGVAGLPADSRQPISNMEHSVDRMSRLINQLMEFRKMQSGKLSLALQETDVVAFLYDIFMSFHETAENKRINYQFLPQEKELKAYIDRNHVDKIVYNLLSNAFKYTPSGGKIELKVGVISSGTLAIVVSDTGIGVSREKQGELFERYSTGKVSADSIGIGLNLTRELVRVHHGTITYSDNPGGGSVFAVTLPLDKSVYAESDFMNNSTALANDDEQQRHGFKTQYREVAPEAMNNKRVLVVDDDADICVMLKTELGKYFVVSTADNGAEALSLMQSDDALPDIIVSDVMMPVMGGLELVRKVRADKRLQHIPIVLLTALQDMKDKAHGLDVGADAYVVKPFSVALLVAQIANLIKQRDMLKRAYAKAPQQKDTAKEVIRSEKDKRFIEQLDAFVLSRLADATLSVDMLAEAFKVGRTTISTRVRALTGKSPAEYIKDMRLDRAAELLRSDDVNISEVAYQVGFSSPQYLSVAFKQKFGISPKKYQMGK